MTLNLRNRPALLIACAGLLLGIAGCGSQEGGDTGATAGGNTPVAENAPAANAPETTASAGKADHIVIETSMGTIEADLYPDKAPLSVKNFEDYAKKGFYTGTVFHRVIPGFMIQGGGFTADLKEKPTAPPIKNEASNGLKNDRGTLAMARTGDPDSATAQFYINVADNAALNPEQAQDGVGYAVFGKVTKGMDVVDQIVAVPTTTKQAANGMPLENCPEKTVTIKSVKIAG